jgi:hypothetical protein
LEKAKVTQKERPIIGFIDTHGTEATMAGHTNRSRRFAAMRYDADHSDGAATGTLVWRNTILLLEAFWSTLAGCKMEPRLIILLWMLRGTMRMHFLEKGNRAGSAPNI